MFLSTIHRPPQPVAPPRGSTGRLRAFTLVEILVLLALFSFLAAISFPAVQTMMAKARLETAVQQTATVFQSARLQAIRQATSARVSITTVGEQKWVDASIDRNRDGSFESKLGVVHMNRSTQLVGPTTDSAGVVGWTGDILQFNSDGSLAEAGAVRISGRVGGDIRYYEVRVSPVAAPRISVREWDSAASKWVEKGDE